MIAAERMSTMIELLHKTGFIRVEDLATTFGVSEMTVRRDLIACEKKGLLKRCHGGAVLCPGVEREFAYSEKASVNVSSKERIAVKCVSLIENGMTVYLDAGTTTGRIVEKLGAFKDLTVITCDLQIAIKLANMDKRVIFLGGIIQNSSYSVYGPLSEKILDELWIDVSFISTNFIDMDYTIYSAEPLEKAVTKMHVMKVSNRSYLVVDASKFNRKSLYKTCVLEDFSGVVTEREFSTEERKRLEKRGINIISAK